MNWLRNLIGETILVRWHAFWRGWHEAARNNAEIEIERWSKDYSYIGQENLSYWIYIQNFHVWRKHHHSNMPKYHF